MITSIVIYKSDSTMKTVMRAWPKSYGWNKTLRRKVTRFTLHIICNLLKLNWRKQDGLSSAPEFGHPWKINDQSINIVPQCAPYSLLVVWVGVAVHEIMFVMSRFVVYNKNWVLVHAFHLSSDYRAVHWRVRSSFWQDYNKWQLYCL
jgi:hypothetical protein